MKKHLFLSLVFVLLLTVACKETVPELPEIPLNTEYTFDFGDVGLIENTDVEVRFEVLADNRCPTGANCLTEGRAWVKLVVVRDNIIKDIELITENSVNLDSMVTADYLDYQFELIRVDPYPEETSTIALVDYEVTIVVTEL